MNDFKALGFTEGVVQAVCFFFVVGVAYICYAMAHDLVTPRRSGDQAPYRKWQVFLLAVFVAFMAGFMTAAGGGGGGGGWSGDEYYPDRAESDALTKNEVWRIFGLVFTIVLGSATLGLLKGGEHSSQIMD